ncbi:MAG: nucleoside monophosphate kinase, partial [Planctomycetes bacterium]|nr:nucleoside monophosphate kinase [Planctomycetota bacterium]
LFHFATGDILREAVDKDTPEGQKAKPFMTAGQLVPDDLVNDIVNARLRGPQQPRDFVLDGYPRTLAQAIALDSVLKEQSLGLNAVVFLDVEDEEIVRRLGNRWTCPNTMCKAIYHALFKPAKVAGRCDLCQTPLYQRDDDKPATIRKRLQVFHECHDAILRHYRDQRLLIEVPGRGDIEAIYADLVKALGG